MKHSKRFFIFAVLVLLWGVFCLWPTLVAQASANPKDTLPPPAPTLISPDKTAVIGAVKPNILGLTASGTTVYVYIDGVYNGRTEILTHESGTANFVYRPFLNLSVGEHIVWTVAKNRQGIKSKVSKALNFKIEEPLPAPTMYQPVVNSRSSHNQPFIVGLTKNDTEIKVFIDHKFSGRFKAVNHESGTANFAYKPAFLTDGQHLVYTTAVDKRGKESAWSNIIYFKTHRPIVPAISLVAVEASYNEEIEKNSVENPSTSLDPARDRSSGQEKEVKVIEHQGKSADANNPVKDENKELLALSRAIATTTMEAEINELINSEKDDAPVSTGLINESRESQSKLKLNLVIFILFLLAVIIWIFWVNRELIRERRGQNDDDREDEDRNDSSDYNI